MLQNLETPVSSLLDFIKKSVSPYHAVLTAKEMLTQAGYTELNECDEWQLQNGGRYFVTRNLSSIIAFRIPTTVPTGFMMAASHSDSPTFKIKDQTEMTSTGYVRLNTERYGGMICSTWLDRPLSVAGKVIIKTATNQLCTKLINIERDLLMIPNVAIHMNRNANDGFAFKANVDMIPLLGDETAKGSFRKIIADAAEVAEEDIISTDLFLVNRAPGTVWGASMEYVSAPRLDDLECAYTTLKGFICADESSAVPMCAILDNEEVGSTTKQGANSTFLTDTMDRIAEGLQLSRSQYCRMISSSFMVSADNAHAVHPNHPEFSDPTNKVYMNRGIVLKYNASQKYTTDSVSDAIFTEICRKAGAATQKYTNRADMPGGSTLGNIANTHVSVNTVDIGLAQLAMHSSYETAGVQDIETLIRAMTEFYSSSIRRVSDGNYELM
jgi:aspartyl aminopeptidase